MTGYRRRRDELANVRFDGEWVSELEPTVLSERVKIWICLSVLPTARIKAVGGRVVKLTANQSHIPHHYFAGAWLAQWIMDIFPSGL